MNISKIIEENKIAGNLLNLEKKKGINKFIDFITNKKEVEEDYKELYQIEEYKDLIFEKIYDNKDLTIIYNMKNNKNEILKSEKYSLNGKLLSEKTLDNENIIIINYYYEINNLILKTTEVKKENNRISFESENYKYGKIEKQRSNEFGELIFTEDIGNNFHITSNWFQKKDDSVANYLVKIIEIKDLINGIVCEKKYGYERLGIFIEQKEINIEDTINKIKELYIYENNRLKEIKIQKENSDINILFNKDKSINRIIKNKNNQILIEKYNVNGELIEFKINDIDIDKEKHEIYLLENNEKKYKNKNELINDTLYNKKIENKELTKHGYILYDKEGKKIEEKNNNKIIYYKNEKVNIIKTEVETKDGCLKYFEEFYDENENLLELTINNKRVSLKKYKEEMDKENISKIYLDFVKINGEKKDFNQDGSLISIFKSDIENNIYSTYNYNYKNILISKVIIEENKNLRTTMIYKEKEECKNINVEEMDKIIKNTLKNSLQLEIPKNNNENDIVSFYIGVNHGYPILNKNFENEKEKEINIYLLKDERNIVLTKTEDTNKFFISEKGKHRIEINKFEYDQLFEELLDVKIKEVFRSYMNQSIIIKTKKPTI